MAKGVLCSDKETLEEKAEELMQSLVKRKV